MTTKLSLYNDALMLCGERFLSSLTEEREPRRLLDQVYSSGGIRACLEMGQWNFAMRTIQIDYDSGVQPDFGYSRAFEKPTDWVVTSALCSDEFFRSPLNRYWDESGYWFADIDTLYVRYVSDDPAYGANLGGWPESFREFVAAHFASKIIRKLSSSDEEEDRVVKLRKTRLLTAKSRAAMSEATSFPARGSWGLSRNRFPSNRDRGNNGSLIG